MQPVDHLPRIPLRSIRATGLRGNREKGKAVAERWQIPDVLNGGSPLPRGEGQGEGAPCGYLPAGWGFAVLVHPDAAPCNPAGGAHDPQVVLSSAESPVPAPDPAAVAAALPAGSRRVLLAGPPGTGKTTLVAALGAHLARGGDACWCLGADPGSPGFGVPGAVSLGRWAGEGWSLEAVEARGSLDGGRFRLPLVAAAARLAGRAGTGMLLVDGPGVTRGNAGAELLSSLAEMTGADAVVMLRRGAGPPPLGRELAALPVPVVIVQAAAEAARPGRRARGRSRTALWDHWLARGGERALALEDLAISGSPPPVEVPEVWSGRQVALLARGRTVAMGEVEVLSARRLSVRLAPAEAAGDTLLVRDAGRLADGLVGTTAPFSADRLDTAPPPGPREREDGAAAVAARVGAFDVTLVNGVFGDPLLHVRQRHAPRSLLFDLGEGQRLSARVAHQVTDVFISHAHMDHVAGFLWLLRSRMGDFPACRLYGPPGLAEHVEGLVRGVLWDRVGDAGPRFEVTELHGGTLRRYAVQAGRPGREPLGEDAAPDGTLRAEDGFRVRAAVLDHGAPVLAFVLEPARQILVRTARLRARGLAPGPWLGILKARVHAGELDAPVALPDGTVAAAGTLADQLLLVTPGKRLAYATDFHDSAANRALLAALARGAHTLFCEASFRVAEADHAARNHHLTTRACGEIGEAAGVARLVPFHFSRRYEDDPAAVYEEVRAHCGRVFVPRAVAGAAD